VASMLDREMSISVKVCDIRILITL